VPGMMEQAPPAPERPGPIDGAGLRIVLDDLRGPEIRALLEEHLRHMHQLSPPESVHALDLDALRRPEISFWTAWSGTVLLGCGALKQLSPFEGEIKSMRSVEAARGQGVGRRMLEHVMTEAARRRYTRLWLETGPGPAFEPARTLYRRAGFTLCGPFADYREDPYSVFMCLTLGPS
jgi:putative acetyltransferase